MGASVLLVLDVQRGILARVEDQDTQGYLQRLSTTIAAARTAGIHIVFVTTAFRPGYPDASPRNPSTARVKAAGAFVEGDPSVQIHPAITPRAEDILITKRRVSAFHATELDLILRGLDVETVVVTGIATSGAVLSTVRQAADLDYGTVVLRDLCLDLDQEMHNGLMRVFAKHGLVLEAEEWNLRARLGGK